jgi:two-component system, chemotaxis family, CheB/CheR fusion protein
MAKKTSPRRASHRTGRAATAKAIGKPERSPALASALPRARSRPDAETVVGVGASAGGLEAFSQFLQGFPRGSGVAVVFVQHLAPQHDSALVSLLSTQTAMPVVQATEAMHVEPDCVYVIPPNVQMEIRGRELHLLPRPGDRSQYTPVDAFFNSLAESVAGRSVGVVLSGTASDGASGIREIKAAGGITFAQTPETAKYDGMPRAAIATGAVDLVMTPQAMGARIAQLAVCSGEQPTEDARSELDLDGDQLQRVFALLRPVSGVDFRHYKLPTIRRRLLRRMALHRLNEPVHYIRLLESNPGEVRSLYQDLLIHVTRFFREPDSFAALASHVFPALMENRRPNQPIRLWVSGCATGEEAYSLAISLVEFLQRDYGDTRVQVFATDISDSAIEQARAGAYPASIEADVSSERLRRFFTRHDGGYRVTKMIRDLCVFARQDLTRDPPFSRLDMILCRNVLIYMDAVLQKKLLSVFHYALNSNGFLMLGQAETVGAQATLFSVADKKFRIHRKKESSGLATMSFPVEHTVAGLPRRRLPPEPPGAEKALQTEVSRIILDRYAPAGVVVDGDLQIVQFRGQTGAFLEPAPGEASLNLLKMVRDGLLYGLRSAIHAARKSRGSVRKDGLQVKVADRWKPVSVEVIPLTAVGRQHYLVLFDDVTAGRSEASSKSSGKEPRPRVPARERAGQVELLQRELAASREYLQSIIQELEAANEELQSANEEILSSNEELQSANEELDTAKEELQSTNEELNTVNEELHGRNDELSRVNSDLVNLVGSVQIAIVIVSSDLRIRRFTPMAERVLNLIPADLDRSIGHIKPNIDCPNLEQLIADCIDTVSPLEREVQDRQGRWYSLRIRPYKDVDNKIDGAVLALFDVDLPKRSEDRVRLAAEFADATLRAASTPMAVLETNLRIRSANSAFSDLFGLTTEQIADRVLGEIAPSGWNVEGLRRFVEHGSLTMSEFQGLATETSATPPFRARILRSYDGPESKLVLLAAADGSGESTSH